MSANLNNKISIITATYNCANHIEVLINSLRSQTNPNFKWIVADGGSNDGTLDLLYGIDDFEVIIDSRPDFGIYDAINRALRLTSSEYYVVSGADDFFYPDAVDVYSSHISKSCDLVVGYVEYGENLVTPKRVSPWRHGQFAYVASHSVGTMIKRSLHDIYGYYSKKYPIAADQHFLMKVCQNPHNICYVDNCIGTYSLSGVSTSDRIGSITEFYRVQLEMGYNFFVQTMLCMYRIARVKL